MNDDLDTDDYGKLSAHEVHCARHRLAKDHAAQFPARLAMARWRSGAVLPVQDAQPSPRAAWFARIGREHQAWLDRGGFAQHDEVIALRQPTMWHPPLHARCSAQGAADQHQMSHRLQPQHSQQVSQQQNSQ